MLSNLKNLILSFEEYTKTPFALGPKKDSFVFNLEKENKKLLYFGSHHTNDPQDEIFTKIQKSFEEFNPEKVYIEGYRYINTNKKEIIEKYKNLDLEEVKKMGESVFVLKLAIDKNIDFESPEPDREEELKSILDKGFSKKDIYNYYAYRMIAQYDRTKKEKSSEDLKEYIKPYLEKFRNFSIWDGQDLAILENQIYAEIDALDMQNLEKYKDMVDPTPWPNKDFTNINQISQASGDFREEYILENIIKGFEECDKIFVIYGFSHAVKQEKAFREFFK